MILRPFAVGVDAVRLGAFRCSTGPAYEAEVEQWINRDAARWVNDAPHATFQRRCLHVVEESGDLVAVIAWQDIAWIDVEGIWIEVLAVAVAQQHRGTGRAVLRLVLDHLATVDREGDAVAGLVHPDHHRSHAMLTAAGWTEIGEMDGYILMVGSLV